MKTFEEAKALLSDLAEECVIETAAEAYASLPDAEHYVPIEQFGRDHWSTFAYIETRIVDYGGMPAKYHMRCGYHHPAHRHLEGDAPPTRLRGKLTREHHDDWDCAEDLEAAGLLASTGTGMFPIFAMTKEGERVAAALRAHKAAGKNFTDFVPPAKETV